MCSVQHDDIEKSHEIDVYASASYESQTLLVFERFSWAVVC